MTGKDSNPSSKLAALREKAEQGDEQSQWELGVAYFSGDAVTQDFAEARKWLSKAAAQENDAESQYTIGSLFFNMGMSSGVSQDLIEATTLLRKSAEQGYVPAQNLLGQMYLAGTGVTKNAAEAAKWLRKAAEQGDEQSQWMLGAAYAEGNSVTQDLAEAKKWLGKAADQGNTDAKEALKQLDTIKTDPGIALLRHKAGEDANGQGDAKAQYELGLAYAYGKGVLKDTDKAATWFRLAAVQGLENARGMLAAMYACNRMVPDDASEAAIALREQAEQGDADAQYVLQLASAHGESAALDAAMDASKTTKLFLKAAERGNADAQRFLGEAYASGKGVAKDLTEAAKWYAQAADAGQSDAVEALKQMGVSPAIAAKADADTNTAGTTPPTTGKDNDKDFVASESAAFKKEFAELQKKAEQGDMDAQFKLAGIYDQGIDEEGIHIAQNKTEAQKWFRKAAEQEAAQNGAESQYQLGFNYLTGRFGFQDVTAAATQFLKAAEHGYVPAQTQIGSMYLDGAGVTKNADEATKWLRKAAEQGNEDAQVILGKAYAQSDVVTQDFAEAKKWLGKAAEQGNADAKEALKQLESGTAKKADPTIASLQQKAAQGDAKAQYELGLAYVYGKGVLKDTGAAIPWFRKAAVQGLENARAMLAALYTYGDIVTNNPKEAPEWFCKEAEQGDANAQYVLKLASAHGESAALDAATDAAKTTKLFRKAAEQSGIDALYFLGAAYASGKGVPKNLSEAAKWYRKAADKGHYEAKEALKQMGR